MTTLSIAKLSSAVKRTTPLLKGAPGAGRILAAFKEAVELAQGATEKILLCGFLMLEQRKALTGGKQNNQHAEDEEKFSIWLSKNVPEIPLRTAQRWMSAAERSERAIGSGPIIDVGGEVIPMSSILFLPEAELPKEALKYRQQFFDWAQDKTIKDCLNAVAVEGEDSKRITLAHNGKNAKDAGSGGNRKDFVGFIKTKLKHVNTFLFVEGTRKSAPHFRQFSELDQGKIVALFDGATKKLPRWVLKSLADSIKEEMKHTDEDRATRRGK